MDYAPSRPVVIGLLGTTLDRGSGPRRWEAWRPTRRALPARGSPGRPPRADAPAARHATLAETVARRHPPRLARDRGPARTPSRSRDPWDFEEVYGALHDFARGYPFDPDAEDYLVHITTGHARRADLPVPADRVAPLPGAAAPDLAADARQRAGEPGTFRDHRPRPLEVRPDRVALRAGAQDETALLKSGIETRNAAFNALIERIEHVAVRSTAPILLLGPTGAGNPA